MVVMAIGVVGKIGAVFVSIPDPIVGGVFMVMFGMIAAVGISNLQFADMNSSRNLFIVGFSIVFGLALPHYMENHPNAIETGTRLIMVLLYQLASQRYLLWTMVMNDKSMYTLNSVLDLSS